MNVLSKILTTSFKSSLLASALFVLGIFGIEGSPFIIAEIIPAFLIVWVITFIISIVAIHLAILPFYYFSLNYSLDEIFKKCFPYYSMLSFALCLFLSIKIDFKIGSLILSTAYITAMFAWIWFFKPEKK